MKNLFYNIAARITDYVTGIDHNSVGRGFKGVEDAIIWVNRYEYTKTMLAIAMIITVVILGLITWKIVKFMKRKIKTK